MLLGTAPVQPGDLPSHQSPSKPGQTTTALLWRRFLGSVMGGCSFVPGGLCVAARGWTCSWALEKKAPELCSPTLSSAGPCLGLWAADGL